MTAGRDAAVSSIDALESKLMSCKSECASVQAQLAIEQQKNNDLQVREYAGVPGSGQQGGYSGECTMCPS